MSQASTATWKLFMMRMKNLLGLTPKMQIIGTKVAMN